MKTVNLEEIYIQFEYLSRVETDTSLIDTKSNVLKAMKEACRQTLELAANNARCDAPFGVDVSHIINKQSILNTINQIQ